MFIDEDVCVQWRRLRHHHARAHNCAPAVRLPSCPLRRRSGPDRADARGGDHPPTPAPGTPRRSGRRRSGSEAPVALARRHQPGARGDAVDAPRRAEQYAERVQYQHFTIADTTARAPDNDECVPPLQYHARRARGRRADPRAPRECREAERAGLVHVFGSSRDLSPRDATADGEIIVSGHEVGANGLLLN